MRFAATACVVRLKPLARTIIGDAGLILRRPMSVCWFCLRYIWEGFEWHHSHRCQVIAVLFPEHNLAPAAAEVPLPLRLLAAPRLLAASPPRPAVAAAAVPPPPPRYGSWSTILG